MFVYKIIIVSSDDDKVSDAPKGIQINLVVVGKYVFKLLSAIKVFWILFKVRNRK